MANKQSRLTSYAYLLINVLTWGAALPIVKVGLDYTTPFRYLTYRYIIAIICSLPLLFYFWPKVKKPWKVIKIITLHELVGTTLALGLLYLGLSKTSALDASLLTTTTPIFITLGGIWLLKEKEERHEWIGMLLAFVGALGLVFLPALFTNSSLWDGNFTGNTLVFLQNIATAIYFILAKKYYRNLPKFFVTTISFYVGFLSFGLFSLIEAGSSFSGLLEMIRQDLTHVSVWIAAGYMAIFGSIIGLTAYIKGQDGIEASEAGLFGYLQPLVYIPLAFFLLGESIDSMQLLALGVVIFGVFIAERRFMSHR